MRKIYSLMSIALLLVATGVNAQDVSIGVKGGLTIPSIRPGGTKTPLSEGYSSRLAWGGGAFTELQFTETFSLTVGLEYSGQGGQKKGMQALPAGPITGQAIAGIKQGVIANLTPMMGAEQAAVVAAGTSTLFPDDYIYADFKSTAKFNYLMLPVQAKFGCNFSPTSPFRAYVSVGLFASYLMKAERVSEGSSRFYTDYKGTLLADYADAVVKNMAEPAKSVFNGILSSSEFKALGAEQNLNNTQDITDQIYRFNYGFIGNVGVSYDFAARHRIFIEGGGNFGLKKIQKDDANGQNRIGAGVVMIGYSYKL